MYRYYVNKKLRNGDHEVHREDCGHLPEEENRQYLGYFETCQKAVKKAKEDYSNVDGCYYCSNDCHTG